MRGRGNEIVPLASVFTLLTSFANAQQQPPPPRDWNQRCGNAANTSACDVEPVRGPPKEAWRFHADALLAGPVVTGERLFVVVKDGKDRRLVAIKPASGEIVARKTLDKGGDVVELVADGAYVAEVEPDHARIFHLAGDTLKWDKTLDGSWDGEPMVVDGQMLLRKSGGGYDVVEPASAKLLGTITAGCGRPAFERGDKDSLVATALAGLDDAGNVMLRTYDVRLRGAPSVQPGRGWTSAHYPEVARARELAVVVPCTHAYQKFHYGWFEQNAELGALFLDGSAIPVRFKAPPVAFERFLLGFAVDGRLLKLDAADHGYFELVRGDALPKGAVRGEPSRARDVLYLGNWAVELGSERVLWCVEGLDPEGPAIPAGDGLVVVRTRKNELVGLADPNRAAPVASAPKERPRLPSEDAALAAKLAGDERATYDACRDALAADQADALVALFDRYASFKLFDECQRVLEAAKKSGLDEGRRDELSRRIAGKQSSKADNAGLQRNKLHGEEKVGLEKLVARTLAVAEWCAQKSMPFAATALVRRAGELLPDRPAEAARAAAWMPANFPWREHGNAADRWLEWADALLPSGASFVPREDPVWKRVKGTPFESDAVALRTANLLLFTRDDTAQVVGKCLLRGEAAVRALDRLLGPSPVGAKDAGQPLEIRLHKTREDYLADRIGGRDAPVSWSSGVYSPAEGVSRFYSSVNDAEDPLGRELHTVLAHELTHHYIDGRFIPGGGRDPLLAGVWLVEGFAEFVAEQAVEMGRRGEALDDPTVSSIDVTAAMARRQAKLPLQFLLGLTQSGFEKELGGGASEPLELRHSLKKRIVDRRGLFYAESAALTFFALRRGQEAGVKGYLELLQAFYRGQRVADPWKKLGFADLASLERAFDSFLAGR